MVYVVSGDFPLGFVVVISTCIHVSVKSGEVGRTDLNSDSVPFFEVIGCTHRRHFDLVDLAFLS